MGWRERDYAKWTDEERRPFLDSGGGSSRGGRDPFLGGHGGKYTARPERSARVRLNNGIGLAILVSGALFLLGEFPRHHPILPTLHLTISLSHHAAPHPASPGSSYTLTRPHIADLNGPRSAPLDRLTLQGSTAVSGTVTVEGIY